MEVSSSKVMTRCYERIAAGEASRFDAPLLLRCLLEDEHARRELVSREIDVEKLERTLESRFQGFEDAPIVRRDSPEVTEEFKSVITRSVFLAKDSAMPPATQLDILRVIFSDPSLEIYDLIMNHRLAR